MNLFYYTSRFAYNSLPGIYFKWKYKRLKQIEEKYPDDVINERLNYYCRTDKKCSVPELAIRIKDFKRTHGTTYYLDLKEFLHYFKSETKIAYQFGDDTHINPYPTLFKARPINGDNQNSVLFKLNKRRHFKWVNDIIPFKDKKDKLVWRGGAYQALRKEFVKKFHDNRYCNIGQTNKPKENVPWQKEFMSIKEQLTYKFIFCPEGNDVASNLKWVMSSNSLCIMPKPKFETWFMEGMLQPGIHYVQVKDDFSDLEDVIAYYSSKNEEAEEIIKSANDYVKKFQDKNLEDILCIKVLEKFTSLYNTFDTLKFKL